MFDEASDLSALAALEPFPFHIPARKTSPVTDGASTTAYIKVHELPPENTQPARESFSGQPWC